MEEYRDLELSLLSFMQVLSEPEFFDLEAGIVLQAYIPDSHAALDRLITWANDRHARGGAGLHAPAMATTVRLRGNERLVQDGPFTETKELLGGLFMIEAPDLDAALAWAARCPAAATGSVEVRPMLPPPPIGA
jgi:hypothetical protein